MVLLEELEDAVEVAEDAVVLLEVLGDATEVREEEVVVALEVVDDWAKTRGRAAVARATRAVAHRTRIVQRWSWL